MANNTINPVNNIKKQVTSNGYYLCPELGRTSNRAGAYDAYDLPSLYNNDRKLASNQKANHEQRTIAASA